MLRFWRNRTPTGANNILGLITHVMNCLGELKELSLAAKRS